MNQFFLDYEYFDFFIVFTEVGDVEAIKVFKYEATHGHEVTARGWLKQFRSYTGESDLVVGKDINGISGATTSVYSITYEIQERTKRLKKSLAYYKDSISSNNVQKIK